MNKIRLISISLLLLVIGISCAVASDCNANDAPLGSGLGGGGNQNMYAPACVDVISNGHVWAVASNGPNIFTSDLPALPALSDLPILGGGLGGGGNQNFY